VSGLLGGFVGTYSKLTILVGWSLCLVKMVEKHSIMNVLTAMLGGTMTLTRKYQQAKSWCNQWLINKAIGIQYPLRKMCSRMRAQRISIFLVELIIKIMGRSAYRG